MKGNEKMTRYVSDGELLYKTIPMTRREVTNAVMEAKGEAARLENALQDARNIYEVHCKNCEHCGAYEFHLNMSALASASLAEAAEENAVEWAGLLADYPAKIKRQTEVRR